MSKYTRELATYMSEVGRHPVIDRAEELRLAKLVVKGDMAAREKIVVSNLRFVVQVANQFRAYTEQGKYSILDLIQEGNSGLLLAIRKYDHKKGYRFITYAVWWIRAQIMGFIIRSHSVVKLGTTATERKLFFKMGRIRHLLTINDVEERQKARESLALELNSSPALIQKMEDRIFWHDTSIDKPLTQVPGEQASPLRDFIGDESKVVDELEENDLRTEVRSELDRAFVRLTPKEKEVIEKRYLGEEIRTLQSIADDYNLSRERIRQIEAAAFSKLKPLLMKSEAIQDMLSTQNRS